MRKFVFQGVGVVESRTRSIRDCNKIQCQGGRENVERNTSILTVKVHQEELGMERDDNKP
jgi:hypothetical protein